MLICGGRVRVRCGRDGVAGMSWIARCTVIVETSADMLLLVSSRDVVVDYDRPGEHVGCLWFPGADHDDDDGRPVNHKYQHVGELCGRLRVGEHRRRKSPFDCIRAAVQSVSSLSFCSTSTGTRSPTSEYIAACPPTWHRCYY